MYCASTPACTCAFTPAVTACVIAPLITGSFAKSEATWAPRSAGIPSAPINLKVGPIAVFKAAPVLAYEYKSTLNANFSPKIPLYPSSQEAVVPNSADGVSIAVGNGLPSYTLYP